MAVNACKYTSICTVYRRFTARNLARIRMEEHRYSHMRDWWRTVTNADATDKVAWAESM